MRNKSNFAKRGVVHKKISKKDIIFGFQYSDRKVLRNLVNPEVGLYILLQALEIKDKKMIQEELF